QLLRYSAGLLDSCRPVLLSRSCASSASLSPRRLHRTCLFFFFNDTATTEIYTLSLHDALPIYRSPEAFERALQDALQRHWDYDRSEEHTSELQSLTNLVCRLLLEKKKRDTRSW